MTALELISLVNQSLFIGLFVVVLRHAFRERTRASVDTALLFGSVAAVVTLSRLAQLTGTSDAPLMTPFLLLLLNLAPFAMVRLVEDFSGTPRWVQIAGAMAYVAIAALGFTFPTQPQLVEVVIITWFMTVGGYAAFAFARESGRTRGITRRRMRAVASGAILFIGAIVAIFVGALLGPEGSFLGIAAQVAALAAVLAFFLGFAPPAWVRRAWREPDLRVFLERSIHLMGVNDERQLVLELQQSAAAAFGATGASIGISDAERPVLRYDNGAGKWMELPEADFIAGRAFTQQRRVVALDAATTDPVNADVYEHSGARTVIAAPITVDDRRIGAMAVYADRAPIFVEDDLWLIELLADHTAVLLEARDLARHAADLQAREDAARLKEEFLSAAAHDLRTPLTVVLGQAELLERRLARDPAAPVDAAGVSRLANEARRLRDLVSELLDAQRLEQPGAIMEREIVDLRELVELVRNRQLEHGSSIEVEVPQEPIRISVDRMRIAQVLDNLIENALKYSVNGAPPLVQLWNHGTEARLSVIDHGVGVPEAEGDRIFDRFYRASNAQSITDTGMGLGLYICRRITEEHGGRIWVEPTPGGGSTFTVALARDEPPGESDEVAVMGAEPQWIRSPAEAAGDA
ncbi:MAG: ATP-binding protein [Chloroflexota bacterium]|nr:ATP-binding protein [Chloroflexota bacterium]